MVPRCKLIYGMTLVHVYQISQNMLYG